MYAVFISGGLKAAAGDGEALHRQLRELEAKAASTKDTNLRRQIDALRTRLQRLDRDLAASGRTSGPSVDVQFIPLAR